MAGPARIELIALIRREARGAEEIADAVLHPANRDLLRRCLREAEGEPRARTGCAWCDDPNPTFAATCDRHGHGVKP